MSSPRSLAQPTNGSSEAPDAHSGSSSHFADAATAVAAVGDIVFFLAGLISAFLVRFDLAPLKQLVLGNDVITIETYSRHFIFGLFLFILIAAPSGLYQRANLLRFRRTTPALINTVIYWTMVYFSLSLLFYFRPPISRLFVLLAAFFGTVLVVLWRYAFHATVGQEWIARRIRQRILLMGWNHEAEKLARSVFKDASHPYEIVGCVLAEESAYAIEPPAEVKRLGTYAQLEETIRTNKVDILLIADLDPKTQDIAALCEFCSREMIQFKVIPSYFEILISGLHLETISSVPVLGVDRLPLDSLLNRTVKRCIDIVGAIVGLLILVPLLLVFGTLVYLESPGPIIYRQVRKGRQGRPFTLYKIRSMKLDAEVNGPQWAKNNDDRVLRVGGFMRTWNIDEFPQFWNVLKGEMSLTGPRPERPELIENFKGQIRHYNARHSVKPGLTGWAQIHGLRGDTDLNERIRYDLYYLENWSPALDLYIMMRTLYKNREA